MNKKKINSLLLASAILLLLQITGCSMLRNLKWDKFEIKDTGFSLQVPGKPRHFVMSSSSSINEEEYDQWTVIDPYSNQQFFIVSAKYDKSEYDNLTDDELLDKVPRPTIGFLSEAKQINMQRFIDKSKLVEEQEWQLETRTNKARSRIYIFDGKILELIHVYSVADKKIKAGDRFFGSLEIE